MVRHSRARTAAAANRSPTTELAEPSDEEAAPTPPQGLNQDEDPSNDAIYPEDEDDQETPAVDSDPGSRQSTPAYARASLPRRRRGGRGTKRGANRRELRDDQDTRDTGSDVGTPKKRGGWRGRGFGGGRWAKRGGPSHVTQVPLDKEGNMANVKDDEVELPEDPEGEQKVDKDGNLKGGREYRVRTFKIEDKGDRLYMLSTEPARCMGFRDSYLFFQKHRQLYKIILAEEAKKDLIERNLIPHSYKGRAIGVVTARSVFREFGAKIIIGGKKVIDEYQVSAARARGDIEGEYAVPEDNLPDGGDEYDRNRYVAWHGASSVYHSGAPSVPVAPGKGTEGKKRKVIVTGANWMFEHAREASRFNSSLALNRRQNLEGIYDIHTNIIYYPKIMQPTHGRWEQLPTTIPSSQHLQQYEELTNGNATAGITDDQAANSIFSDVPPILARKFMITDTYYESPPTSTLGYPGPDEAVMDVGPPGLTHVSEEVLAELPEDCRPTFYKARAMEREWKEKWGSEADDHARAKLRVTYSV